MQLTQRLREILRSADLAHGRLYAVPIGCVLALARRGLIARDWRTSRQECSEGRWFPYVSGIRLSAEGLLAARTLQGGQ